MCVISDVHGNLPALQAVLDEVRRRRPDRIVVAGDLVAQGPHPAETFDALQVHRPLMVRGNTERYLTDPDAMQRRFAGVPDADERMASLQWTRDRLGAERVRALAALPESVAVDGCLVVHGSPGSDERGVFPDTPVELFDDPRWTAMLVCGHTHVPLHRSAAGRHVVNAGSVGWPMDGDPRPSFAVVDGEPGGWHVELVRVEYDRSRTLADLAGLRVPWGGVVRDFIETASARRASAAPAAALVEPD